MKTLILFLLCAMAITADQKPPVLTDSQRAAIYKVLYEQGQVQAQLARINAELQRSLSVCGAGFAVAADDKTGELICVEVPKK